MIQRLTFVFAIALVASQGFAAGSGGGGGMSSSSPQARQLEPEQLAQKHYKAGLKQKGKAWKQEEKATGASSQAKRDKYLAKAQKAYQKAAVEHSLALQANEQMHQAANELGYALRKTGDFKKALGAYNYALQLHPDFAEAIEYRGEAYLALGYLDETKAAYMDLFRRDPALAAQLMTAMQAWVAQHSEPDDDGQAFAAWVAEREGLARATNDVSMSVEKWR